MSPNVSQASQPQAHVSLKPRPAERSAVNLPPEQPQLPSHEAVAQRAYEKFLARASAHGADQDDWLLAEKELIEELDGPKSLQTKPEQRKERSNA